MYTVSVKFQVQQHMIDVIFECCLVTNTHVTAAYTIMRMSSSFQQFPTVLSLMQARGLEIGKYCRSSETAANIGKVIYDDLLNDVIKVMNTNSPFSLILGNKPAFNSFIW